MIEPAANGHAASGHGPCAVSMGGRLGSRRLGARAQRALVLALAAGFCAAMGACESDSFMDPSVVGRWENTPTIVPVLERIDIVERDTGEFVDVTPVSSDDLLPEVAEYRVGPGDGVVVSILDFIESGREARYEQLVDPRGFIVIPQLGEIFISKLSRGEIEQTIVDAVRAKGILDDPLVDVQIPGSRQATFSIFGVVDRAGRYAVPSPEYRLLEAITDAGGLPPTVEKLYVIRQVTLTDSGDRVNIIEPNRPAPGGPGGTPKPAPAKPAAPGEGVDLQDLINELTGPDGQPVTDPVPNNDAEGVPQSVPVPSAPPDERPMRPQPDPQDMVPTGAPELEDIPPAEPAAPPPSMSVSSARQGEARPARPTLKRAPRPSTSAAAPAAMRQTDPPIDLPDSSERPLGTPATNSAKAPALAGAPGAPAGTELPRPARGKWMFLSGEWVNVVAPEVIASGLPDGQDPLKAVAKGQEVITQRVIEVPVGPLVQGVAQYNLVVRAGDVISVPGPRQGFVYIGGPGSARPGVYQLPFTGKLTLQRLIMASGGLSAIAIPERLDLTRMVGQDRQATIRLNLRAIAEGTQPDLFLKPDDMINVGTNFWATPLAVLRGGLRASYGFGFLLDRNFGNDVFGSPPTDRFGN